MLDFHVGQPLEVALKQPKGEVVSGIYIDSDESAYILDVEPLSDRKHWVIIHRENISRIDVVSALPAALASGTFFNPAFGMALIGGNNKRDD